MTGPHLGSWGTGPIAKTFLCLPVAAAAVWTIVDNENWPISETWPALLVLALMTFTCLRPRVRVTENELLIRNPIGSRRVPRSNVRSAEFKSIGMVIHLRDGRKAHAFLAPKMTSTELSGGAPRPDSAAYQITRWAAGKPI